MRDYSECGAITFRENAESVKDIKNRVYSTFKYKKGVSFVAAHKKYKACLWDPNNWDSIGILTYIHSHHS